MKKNYSDGNIIFTLASNYFDDSMKKDIIMSDYSKKDIIIQGNTQDIIRSWGGGGSQTLDSIIIQGKKIIEVGKEVKRIKEVVEYVGRVQALLDYTRETLALAKTYSKAPKIEIGKIAPIITAGEVKEVISPRSGRETISPKDTELI